MCSPQTRCKLSCSLLFNICSLGTARKKTRVYGASQWYRTFLKSRNNLSISSSILLQEIVRFSILHTAVDRPWYSKTIRSAKKFACTIFSIQNALFTKSHDSNQIFMNFCKMNEKKKRIGSSWIKYTVNVINKSFEIEKNSSKSEKMWKIHC